MTTPPPSTEMIIRITLFLLIAISAGCESEQNRIVSENRETLNSAIKVGDDIFEAKKKLVAEGFEIEYGPDFPTKTKRYLMMIVDYGVGPSSLDTFKYTLGLQNKSGPIDGIIKATPEGEITSIE